MEEGRVMFDASAYMLFEATGDSEAAYNFDAAFGHESDASAAAAEDDAQSCSYGSLCGSSTDRRQLHEVVVVDGGGGGDDIRGEFEFDYCSEDEEDIGGSDEEEDDGVVDQCRRKAAAEPTKSKGFQESDVMMSEREGDKLFWEACLAS